MYINYRKKNTWKVLLQANRNTQILEKSFFQKHLAGDNMEDNTMKKIVSFFLCLALAIVFGPTAFADGNQQINPAQTNGQWQIVGTNVNLRSGPGSGYSSAGYVQNGDTFINYGLYPATDGSYWRYCLMTSGVHNGDKGYVANQYTDYR
jgi:uncharacterized protein YraI